MNNTRSLEQRIADLERLLADAVLFIAYAQSKGVHGGEAIAKEIEKNLNQEGRNADLFEANLRRAYLSNADLFEANLSRTYGYNQQTEG